MRIIATGSNLVPAHGAGFVRLGQTARSAGGGNRHVAIATDLAVNTQAINPFTITSDLDDTVTIRGLGVFFPHRAWFNNVSISVDNSWHNSLLIPYLNSLSLSGSTFPTFISGEEPFLVF